MNAISREDVSNRIRGHIVKSGFFADCLCRQRSQR